MLAYPAPAVAIYRKEGKKLAIFLRRFHLGGTKNRLRFVSVAASRFIVAVRDRICGETLRGLAFLAGNLSLLSQFLNCDRPVSQTRVASTIVYAFYDSRSATRVRDICVSFKCHLRNEFLPRARVESI